MSANTNTNTNDESNHRQVPPREPHYDGGDETQSDNTEQSHETAPVDTSQLEINRDDYMEVMIEDAMTPNACRGAAISEEAGWSWILVFRELPEEERKEKLNASREPALSEEEAKEGEGDRSQKPISPPPTARTPPHLDHKRPFTRESYKAAEEVCSFAFQRKSLGRDQISITIAQENGTKGVLEWDGDKRRAQKASQAREASISISAHMK
ncbi:hypothetical protein PG993_005743 [Apiospora rasikravindrae]|uniref:Uncharacterized protein n=1 Tax=Apiospora rasikravindrae TaxID=990691 RepID=A0ABR1T9Q1_9PEZI